MGYWGLMEGAQTCGQCDPSYAGSRAAFQLLVAPGTEASQEPWSGVFGGPAHDHREKPGWLVQTEKASCATSAGSCSWSQLHGGSS